MRATTWCSAIVLCAAGLAACACLSDESLPQWMSASDEVLIAYVEALDVLEGWYSVELAVRTTVALTAGEDEVPNAIEVVENASALKRVGYDVIDVGEVGVMAPDADVSVAVEAGAPLVTIQRSAASSDLGAPVAGEEIVAALIGAHHRGIKAEVPGGFDQTPSAVHLCTWRELLSGQQVTHRVRQHDSFGLPLTLVTEEARAHLAVGHDVEGIDDVVEAQPHRDVCQAALVQMTAVVLTTGLEELAPRRCGLSGSLSQMLGQVKGVWSGEFLQAHLVLALLGEVDQGLCRGELV